MDEKIDTRNLLTKCQFATTDLLCKIYEEKFFPLVKTVFNMTEQEKEIASIFHHIYFRLLALIRLDHALHYETMMSIVRSVFEHYVDLTSIHQDETGVLLEKYQHYPTCARYKAARKIIEKKELENGLFHSYMDGFFIDQANQCITNTESTVAYLLVKLWDRDIADEKGNLRDLKKLVPNSWSGKNARDLAGSVGLDGLYLKIYPIHSWFVHGGPTGFARIDEKTIEAMFYFAHNVSDFIFIESMKIVAERLSLSKAIDGFYQRIQKLKDASKDIFQEEYLKMIGEIKEETYSS